MTKKMTKKTSKKLTPKSIAIYLAIFVAILLFVPTDSDDELKNQQIVESQEDQNASDVEESATDGGEEEGSEDEENPAASEDENPNSESNETLSSTEETGETTENRGTYSDFNISDIPAYSGNPYIAVNNNVPYFTDDELTTESFETYSELDNLGRCGVTTSCVGYDLMPTEDRGSIGEVKPTGWHTVKYDCVDGKYLYNRCHLIGFQLTGENANRRNLITGTRYLNIEGMLPFENLVSDYVKETGNHVMYRVTPVFEGENLIATGVLMEGKSVEDDEILYNVFCYNVQPGVIIDYATGESNLSNEAASTNQEISQNEGVNQNEEAGQNQENSQSEQPSQGAETTQNPTESQTTYILNTNTKKIHKPTCSSAKDIKESNREEVTSTKDDLIMKGYDSCKRCNP